MKEKGGGGGQAAGLSQGLGWRRNGAEQTPSQVRPQGKSPSQDPCRLDFNQKLLHFPALHFAMQEWFLNEISYFKIKYGADEPDPAAFCTSNTPSRSMGLFCFQANTFKILLQTLLVSNKSLRHHQSLIPLST